MTDDQRTSDQTTQNHGPDPELVEDLLRATLEDRAADVEWRAAFVTDAVHGAGRPAGVRVIRAARPAAWLAAAAAVALIAGGGAVAVRSLGPTDGVVGTPTDTPTRGPTPSSAAGRTPGSFGLSPTLPAAVRWPSCAAAFASGTMQPAEPTASSDATQDLTGTASPTGVAVPTQRPGTTDPLAVAVASDLGAVLDGTRFAGFSAGPEGNALTVHVVRGVDESGARALARSCARAGVTVRTDLVDWSTDELAGVIQDVFTRLPSTQAPGQAVLTSGWVDMDGDRAVISVSGQLTAGQWSDLRDRYGDMLAVWLQDEGHWGTPPA